MKRFSVGALALSALVTVLLATACGGKNPIQTPTLQAGATASSSRNRVATPTFDPVAGTYSSAVSVTLSDATNGVAIYYTTDRTTPSKASTLYTRPITVSSTTTIEAVATKNGFSDSAIASATYTISSTSPTTYTVGGSITGLSGTVVLQDNGGDNLTATADGTFTFATPLADGSGYSVTVSTQPSGQTCTVANGSGTIAGANVTNVGVSCSASSSTATYTVGGSITGLSGTVVLQDNGGDNLTATADGTFTFATPLADGSGYSVTVSTQPICQTCTVANGTGTIADANVTNVAVSCTDTTVCINCMAQECPSGYICPLDPMAPPYCVSSCGDGLWNSDEGDVDCGGSCVYEGFPRCVSGQHCWTSWDCASGVCLAHVCQ